MFVTPLFGWCDKNALFIYISIGTYVYLIIAIGKHFQSKWIMRHYGANEHILEQMWIYKTLTNERIFDSASWAERSDGKKDDKIIE